MFYSIDGNIVKLEGGFPQRKINSLTYQAKGSWFPRSFYNYSDETTNTISGPEELVFESDTPNAITVSYGDGTVVTREFELQPSGRYRIGYDLGDETLDWVIPQHSYSDNFTGIRNIVFEFEHPETLNGISSRFVLLHGSLPSEVNSFGNLKKLLYLRSMYISTIPDSIPDSLQNLTFSSVFIEKPKKIIDSVFSSSIEVLGISNSYDLSNIVSSNLFKINQLKNTLYSLSAEGVDMVALPDSIRECILLSNLRISNNKFTEIPPQLNSLVNLSRLYVGSDSGTATNTDLPLWDNLTKLSTIFIQFDNLDLSQIPSKWKYLFSLNYLLQFKHMVTTNQRFDEFVEHFYTLCTNEGNITQDANAFGGIYPNRFRNISWGHSSLAFTGTKQAPTGYIQGVSNGNPVNEGEKVYVLQNQYGHTITHA